MAIICAFSGTWVHSSAAMQQKNNQPDDKLQTLLAWESISLMKMLLVWIPVARSRTLPHWACGTPCDSIHFHQQGTEIGRSSQPFLPPLCKEQSLLVTFIFLSLFLLLKTHKSKAAFLCPVESTQLSNPGGSQHWNERRCFVSPVGAGLIHSVWGAVHLYSLSK